jgi:periplasmic divalent cation tolerance protein
MSVNAIAIYIPCPSKSIAEKIAKHLLAKKLIGCSNIFAANSMYWWKGKFEKSDEKIIFAKALEKNYRKIVKETKGMHPYEVPLIAKFNVEVNEEYLKWLRDC